MKKNILSFLSCLYVITVCAQDTLPVPQSIAAAYVKQTRSKDGKPGARYWQNRAAYDISADFNPSTRLLKGTVNIAYKNSSPDTLQELWFKLYPNLYKKGVTKNIKAADQNDGVQITAMRINKVAMETGSLIIDGTNMHTAITQLLPGKALNISIDYNYEVNKGSHMRTGLVDESSFFIAYFFPRIAVYDDVDGWNKYPYRGSEEFYNDFCNFSASITVPKNFVVWATGDLQNAGAVLNSTYVNRMRNAGKNNEMIFVIDSADLLKGNITKQSTYNTWKFSAKNVTDLVFATSDHYLWQSTSVVVDPTSRRRTRVDAVFNPIHKDYYEVLDFARKTVDYMSTRFPAWPYPYSHETVFDGLDQMEYPMMVNDNPTENRRDAVTLTDHEIFHTMFPFYMGINETKYAWMDEGWATVGEWLISRMIDSSFKDDYGIEATAKISGTAMDQPIMTLTTELNNPSGFTDSYPKPAFGYLYVKDYLGDELFKKALHTYIRQWQGKHPTPYDFFNSMNQGSGKNMNWFWTRWFFDGGVLDMAVQSVTKDADGYTIRVENKSQKPLPVDVTVTYEDGSLGAFHKNIGVWQLGQSTIDIKVLTNKTMRKAELGAFYTPDKNKKDNVWEGK